MGKELGLSREWVSKLETGKEEPSERVQLKMEKIANARGIHIGEPTFTSRLKSGDKPDPTIQEAPARFGGVVASRIPAEHRRPSTRAECEAYFAELLDRAAASNNPNAFPSIHHRLLQEFDLDEWDQKKPK